MENVTRTLTKECFRIKRIFVQQILSKPVWITVVQKVTSTWVFNIDISVSVETRNLQSRLLLLHLHAITNAVETKLRHVVVIGD